MLLSQKYLFNKLALFVCISFCQINGLIAQQSLRWGNVPKEDLILQSYKWDEDASAVILGDIGAWYPEDWDAGIVKLFRHVRIKILKKEGLKYAEQKLVVRKDEELSNLRAQTINYDPEKKKIIKEKLALKFLPAEPLDEAHNQYRFFFRDAQVGSVIEFSYALKTPQIENLKPWYFQTEIPTRLSEVQTSNFFPYDFEVVHQGLKIEPVKRGHWRMKFVPALPDGPYVTNMKDHYVAIRFQLINPASPIPSDKRWQQILTDINQFSLVQSDPERMDALYALSRGLIRDAITAEEKIAHIHKHLREHMRWNGLWTTWVDRDPASVYMSREGSSAEINMLLYYLLLFADLPVNRLIISTRAHGKTLAYPFRNQFNHLMCYVEADEQKFFLDATRPWSSYDLPPLQVLNGKGWLVTDSTGSWIDIPYNKYTASMISANLELQPSGKLQGSVRESYRGYEAMSYREILYKANEDSLWIKHPATRLLDKNITGKSIEAAKQNELPLTINYEINTGDFVVDEGNSLTLNPRLFWGEEKNPFQLDERRFPIDFGYQSQKVLLLNIALPPGYKATQLPQNTRMVLPGKEAEYQFQTEVNGNLISIQSSLTFRKAVLPADLYPHIKILFEKIISHEKETIIIRRE